MSFRRTTKGISNQHLFYSVDYIVFVEGGKGFTKEEVYKGKFDSSSEDINFWKGIFCHYEKSKRFHFRSVGSKSTLVSIIEDIQNNTIKNVFVAIDRDHDVFIKKLSLSKNVAYSFGYSWENDVWNKNTINQVLETLCSAINSDFDIQKEISKICDNFYKDIKFAVCCDAYLHCSGKQAFIPRGKHLACLNFNKKTPPSVSVDKIKELCTQLGLEKSKIISFGKKHKINPARDCYGHLLSDFFYWLVVYIVNKIAKLPTIAKYYINCLAIDKFINNLSSGKNKPINDHYSAFFCNRLICIKKL